MIEHILFLTLLPFVMSQAVNITCIGHYEVSSDGMNLTTCSKNDEIQITNQSTIVNIIIANTSTGRRVNALNVDWFKAENQTIYYLPNGIPSSLPKISHLTIKNSHLKMITSMNMKDFTNLTYLDLSGNEIQIIEPALFEYNQKLEVIMLNNNRIYYIHHEAFLLLSYIKLLDVMTNPCYSTVAQSHEQAVRIPQMTLCPLDIPKLLNQMNHIKYSLDIIFISIASLIIIIFIMFVIMCCKLKSKANNSAQSNVKMVRNVPEIPKSVFYSHNNYNGGNKSEPKEANDDYDEVNFSRPNVIGSAPEMNTDDFYDEIPIKKEENDQENNENSNIYARV
ncbi:slit homolog 1 protein-like [Chironomus tepperi]|uniref:slit homolog 1 protein-like n=1 Tax=Chironomus tepperi TaxID=113505 RepID=UPI00391EE8D3